MAKTTEKLVLSFDAESQSYKPAGHNLLTEQAVEQTEKLQAEGGKYLIADQDRHHRTLSHDRCKSCRKAAEDATATHGETSDQRDGGNGTPAEEQSESE